MSAPLSLADDGVTQVRTRTDAALPQIVGGVHEGGRQTWSLRHGLEVGETRAGAALVKQASYQPLASEPGQRAQRGLAPAVVGGPEARHLASERVQRDHLDAGIRAEAGGQQAPNMTGESV